MWHFFLSEFRGNTPLQVTERIHQNTDVKFHALCDTDIEIMDDGTTATKKDIYRSGVCFMNRPMTYEDRVHLHGSSSDLINRRYQAYVRIGLTNKDPDNLHSFRSKMETCGSTLQRVEIFEEGLPFSEVFDLRIALRRNATLSIKLNGNRQPHCVNPDVSDSHPMWLVIQPNGIKSIKIKHYTE